MSLLPAGAGLAFLFSFAFLLLYVVMSAFAQALESLSPIRRNSLLEENPARYRRLLDPTGVHVSRIAVRLSAQIAVLGGLFSLGTAFTTLQVPEAWLATPVTILLGWVGAEVGIIRWISRRGADALVSDFGFLIPVVVLFSAPLHPFLARLVTAPADDETASGDSAGDDKDDTRDADVRALLDVAREEGIFEKHEEELLVRAVDFSDRTVREVMTPRPDMKVADASLSLDGLADLFERTKHTRIPVVEGSVDKPIGIVHVKDVFSAVRSEYSPATARTLCRPLLFAPESQTITTLLSDFQRRRSHMAVVVDEYGDVAGLVTLEDLVEELVGEIADEHESSVDPVLPLREGAYSVAGRVRVSEIATLFDTTLQPGDYDTVAGLVSARLGHIPRPGESVDEAGLRFTVEEADRKRVHRVKVVRIEGDAA